MPEATVDVSTAGSNLLSAATALAEAAERPGASQELPTALALIGGALRLVGGSVGALTHDAVVAARHATTGERDDRSGAPSRPLSREQEARLATTLHGLAQDISLRARSCARTRQAVEPLLVSALGQAKGREDAQGSAKSG